MLSLPMFITVLAREPARHGMTMSTRPTTRVDGYSSESSDLGGRPSVSADLIVCGATWALVERFGKKYQWIAYHDSLARVADNFHVSRVYAELDPSALCLRPCPGSPNAGSSSRGESKGRWR